MRYLRIITILAFLGCVWPNAAQAANSSPTMPGEIVLKLQPALQISASAHVSGFGAAQIDALLAQAGATTAHPIGTSQTYRIRLRNQADPAMLAQQLHLLSGVVFAEPNAIRTLSRTPDDPVIGQQWALRNIQAYAAWDITTGSDVTIAILDTGVSASHPDLKGRVRDGYDFYNNRADASDDEGHGTYSAGVAAAQGDNGIGIAGVCWACQILPVKVLGSRGQGDDATIAEGIRWATDQGARIISMSLAGTGDTQVLREAVAYAHGHGALLIAASGNGQAHGNRRSYPAAYPEVVAVSASDGSDVVTGFSTTGDFVDLSAPGVGVWSTVWTAQGDSYAASNGTSAACPYVAGAAALILSIRPDLNADQVAQILTRSADDRGPPGKDPENGYGRLNLFRAVQLASDPNLSFAEPTPAAPPPPIANQSAFLPVEPAATAGVRFFAETGHTLRGEFRSFWEQQGGLPIFGFPISEVFSERGEDGRDYSVQYFQRHRFEWHPENKPPYNVLLSRLGNTTLAETGRDWQSFAKTGPQPGCRFFAETGQSVCGAFLRYWQTNGLEFDGRRGKSAIESMALFGLPLSPAHTETLSDGRIVLVQWFERARFEDHGSAGVLLGLLATDLAQRRGYY
jgi:hypothetical protein